MAKFTQKLFYEKLATLEGGYKHGEKFLVVTPLTESYEKAFARHADRVYSIAKKKPKLILKHAKKIFDRVSREDLQDYIDTLKRKRANKDYKQAYTFDRDGMANFLLTISFEIGYYSLLIYAAEQNKLPPPLIIGELHKIINERAAVLFPDQYGKTLQGAMINQLRQIGKRAGVHGLLENDAIVYDTENIKLAFLKSSKYGGVAMTVPMQKVLSMYHEELCKILPNTLEELGNVKLSELKQYSKVRITLDQYMDLTKTKDKKTARKTVKEACDRLYEISFIATVKKGKDAKTYKGRLFQSQMVSYRGGVYEMEYSNDFLEYCSTTTPAAFHHAMYQIQGKYNPFSWGLGQKLRQHFEINRGKKNANRLSVKKLKEAVPDIPTYEDVMAGDKHVNKRIIEPFERDMDKLQELGIVKSWEYCNLRGRKLTKDQLDGQGYKEWEKLYITFELDLPSQEKYIEKHKKRIEAAKKKAEQA